jgi:16S rRNA (cytosine967-C5)-methyltransferase
MGVGLPSWVEFKDLQPNVILRKADQLMEIRKFRESIPDWLDDLGSTELGAAWDDILHSLNQPARVVLRANKLKTNRLDLMKELTQEGVETTPLGQADAIVLKRRQNVFITKAFRSGLFEVQDYSSQLVAQLLAPEPGMRVVDACAGGGGKALHIAALMQNKGSLIALDTVGWKLHELKIRARRAGVSNIETREIDSRKVVKRLYNMADRLLLDVPCSGLGVLRRNPDAKWKTEPERLAAMRTVQQEILRDYSPILKPGGQMVYATCSILPSENQAQVQQFLGSEAGKDFTLVAEKIVLPQDMGFDGFYMALMQKKQHDTVVPA